MAALLMRLVDAAGLAHEDGVIGTSTRAHAEKRGRVTSTVPLAPAAQARLPPAASAAPDRETGAARVAVATRAVESILRTVGPSTAPIAEETVRFLGGVAAHDVT